MLAIYILIASVLLATALVIPAYARKSRFGIHQVILWIAPLCVTAGALLIVQQSSRLNKTEAMKQWPKADGMIINSWLEGERAMHPVVKYSYTVDSYSYTKEDTLYTPSFGGKRRKYEVSLKTMALYPPGDSISVQYDPNDPTDAYVAINENWDLFGKMSFGFTLFTLGLLVILAPKNKRDQ